MSKVYVVGDVFLDICQDVSEIKPNFEGFAGFQTKLLLAQKGGAYNVFRTLVDLADDAYDVVLAPYAPVEIKNRYYKHGKPWIRIDTSTKYLDYSDGGNYLDIPDDVTDIVIVDYNKGSINERVFEELASWVGKAAFWIHSKYNITKYSAFGGVLFTNGREFDAGVWNDLVVRTRGASGAELLLNDEVIARQPSRTHLPNTVINAGDIVMGAFVDACVRGGSFENALEWSQEVVGQALDASEWLGVVPTTIPKWNLVHRGWK